MYMRAPWKIGEYQMGHSHKMKNLLTLLTYNHMPMRAAPYARFSKSSSETRGYKIFFVLNSAELKISNAH